MTIYQTLSLIHQYGALSSVRLSKKEKQFLMDMIEAAQGVGNDPTDAKLYEQCGMTKPREIWIRCIGRKFGIKHEKDPIQKYRN